ncbi:MAG: nuclear transport factor 2 family protein [Planctomycetota bacterium]
MNEQQISKEVIDTAAGWAASFNRGDASGCADFYTENAKMQAEPMAQVQGREAIREFWKTLIDGGYADVQYLDPKVKVLSESKAELRSPWSMNLASGLIHRELWERQEDGNWRLADDHFEVIEQASSNA